MSQDMTIDRDGMAAEYVLGTLDAEERRAAHGLLTADAEFAAKVKQWERRLGELHLMVEPVEPEAHVWQRIKARLPEPPPKPQTKPEEAAIGSEPTLQPDISGEADKPEEVVAEPVREPDPAPEPEPQSAPEIDKNLELERNHDHARKTAAEVNFESAIAAVESALASRGAASAAKSEGTQATALEPATGAAAPADQKEADGAGAASTPRESDSTVIPPVEPAGAIDRQLQAAKRHLAGWRAFALLMSLALAIIVGLVALWRFAPDRLPHAVQPETVMRLLGIDVQAGVPMRKPAPPESQYDE